MTHRKGEDSMTKDLRINSKVFDGAMKAPNRAMLRAVGLEDEDFKKPMVGIASTWSEVTPCNIHIKELAESAKDGARDAGGVPMIFNTITVSDGISMGTQGMRYSLPSRDVIADSIETVVGAESAKDGARDAGGVPLIFNTITVSDGISMGTQGMRYSLPSRDVIADSIETVVGAESMDALVTIGGCDKNMPGCMIAIANAEVPSVFVYGGTIKPGKMDGEDVKLVSVFEGVGQYNNGHISEEQLHKVERCACPGPGSCGGMYTANTMASAIEAMGMSLPGNASKPATSEEKALECRDAGKAAYDLLEKGIYPKDIMTKKSFENAITVVMALGGSTNAILHLLSMAHAMEIDLTIEEFNEVQKRVPHLADLK